jgi:hypothetical protein
LPLLEVKLLLLFGEPLLRLLELAELLLEPLLEL